MPKGFSYCFFLGLVVVYWYDWKLSFIELFFSLQRLSLKLNKCLFRQGIVEYAEVPPILSLNCFPLSIRQICCARPARHCKKWELILRKKKFCDCHYICLSKLSPASVSLCTYLKLDYLIYLNYIKEI